MPTGFMRSSLAESSNKPQCVLVARRALELISPSDSKSFDDGGMHHVGLLSRRLTVTLQYILKCNLPRLKMP
jgi:hypothetical protein